MIVRPRLATTLLAFVAMLVSGVAEPLVSHGSTVGDVFEYDALGRVTKVTHADGTSATYVYSASTLTVTNERGIAVTYQYEAFGDPDERRLRSVADITGTTAYTYNTLGRLRTITQPEGVTRSFLYTPQNFLKEETHPELGTITYLPDEIGNVKQRTDGKGTTTFVYDDLNRLTTIDYPGTLDDVTMGYDHVNNRDRLASAVASYTLTYDAENRLTGQARTTGATTFTTGYGYNTSGNLTTLTYPTGRILTYGYDTANRPTSLAGYITSATYHPSGALETLTYANGKATTFEYDARYRVKRITAPSVIDYTYGYDGVGNIKTITDGLNPARNRGMGYDNVDRLTSATGVWGTLGFGYDAVGNRLSKTLNGALTSYAYVNNRLTSSSGTEADQFTYDTNSNMTGLRGFTLAYDVANRLVNVQNGAVTYTYDGDGKRIKKINTATGKTTLYVYDHAGNVILEANGSGEPQSEYLYLNNQHVAKINIAPQPPTGVTAADVPGDQGGSIQVNWTPSTTSSVTAYYVFRATASGGPYSKVATLSSPAASYTDTGLLNGTTYYYMVRASDGMLESANSNETSAVPVNNLDPTGLVAMATSTTQVALTWTAPNGRTVTAYEVERRGNGAYAVIASPTSTSFTDSGLTGATAYLYRVRAVDASGSRSAYSNIDLATTIMFTDDPVQGGTMVKLVHLNELRQAVNAVRAGAGLGAVTWTDTAQAGLPKKAVHIQELRSNLTQALTVLGFVAPSYTDSTLTGGATAIKQIHVQALRNAVK